MTCNCGKVPPPPPPPIGLQPREVAYGSWIDSWLFLSGMILAVISVVVLKLIEQGIL